jgi:hypothetical protein
VPDEVIGTAIQRGGSVSALPPFACRGLFAS